MSFADVDVYLEDDEGSVYDIEMQAYREENLPKRTRYYQGMIDLNLIERGSKYRDLKKSYIVFICLNNPFKDYGRHKYSIVHSCVEEPSLDFKDDACTIILSAEGDKEDVSEELSDFLHYLATRETRSELARKVEDSVIRSRTREKWRVEYMTLQEHDERIREEGRKEGLKAGLEEGHKEGFEESRLAIIRSIMENLTYTAKQAMDLLSIPVSDQEKYLSKL